MVGVPLIDVSPLLDGGTPSTSEAERCVAQIDRACLDTGFFLVERHGLEEQIAAAFIAARAFFDRSQSDKERVPRSAAHGFVPQRELAIDRTRLLGNTEYLDLGIRFDVEPGDWPSEFTEPIRAYQRGALTLATVLLRALATALHIGPDFFADRMANPDCKLRLLHYLSGVPALSDVPVRSGGETGERAVVTGAHTDYGAITLLATDGVPGLELQPRGRGWTPIEAPADALIVNLGDMLARWTNLRYASTPHRVVTPVDPISGRPIERFSIPFFVNPDPETIVDCLPSCVSATDPCRHEPVTAGEFLAGRVAGTIPEPYVPIR